MGLCEPLSHASGLSPAPVWRGFSWNMEDGGYHKKGLGTVTDLLLRKAQAGRAGAQGDNDYDVIGTDGMVIGHIFEATTSPGVGTPWMWVIAHGNHEGRTHTRGYEATRQAAMQAFGRSWYKET